MIRAGVLPTHPEIPVYVALESEIRGVRSTLRKRCRCGEERWEKFNESSWHRCRDCERAWGRKRSQRSDNA